MKPQRGFTLLEVVAALILMGSVLAGSILAFSRHRKQLANAEKRLEATMIADQLLQQLASQPGGIPVGTRGTVPQHPRWIWQTSLIGRAELATVPLDVVRFRIVDFGDSPSQLVSVDLVEAAEGP